MFAGQEVASQREYPPEYRVAPVGDQLAALQRVFPVLNGALTAPPAALPSGAEAWFVLPRWQSLAETYNAALTLVLDQLARQRTVSFARAERLGPAFLRRHPRTAAMLDGARGTAGANVLVVAAQSGVRHRGRSIRRVREVLTEEEFGLGAFEIGCMLLVHPARLVRSEQLYVDCAGDEYSASDEQQFSEAPFFRVLDGRLGFGTSWIGYADAYFGSATGFRSGSLLL